MTYAKTQLADEQASRNQNLPAPPAVSVCCSLSLGKLLRIFLSFSFTKHLKTVLKNNHENRALHTISYRSSNENNMNACL